MKGLPDIQVRPGSRGDALCVGVLAMHVFLDTYAAEGIRPDLARELLAGYTPDDFAARLADPRTRFHLAERDGHLVAFSEVVRESPCPVDPAPGDAELVRLYVQRGSRGRGLGRDLLRWAERSALDGGASRLWLFAWTGNQRAIAFYHGLGYRTLGPSEYVFEDHVYELEVLARDDLSKEQR